MAMLRGGEAVLILLAIPLGCGRPLVSGDEVGEESSSTTTDSEPDCGGFSLDPEYVPPVVMLVVDTSSSMALESWDADGDPQTPDVTRWSSARANVEALVGEFGEGPLVGIQRFPSEPACPDAVCSDADACLVEAS
ncbi:MAG: hypothetical protein HC927_10445, partial [Deltaproteobacteria bacterium]|nr:hypothetical protein [Deltaproteobacteria bacterium]